MTHVPHSAYGKHSLRALFWSFFKIGLFTFGGGYAMIPLIQQEMIERRGWIASDEFIELLTLAQSSPGPMAINTSVFVGYKLRGLPGAVASMLGSVLPSFVIILLIAVFFADIRHNRVAEAAFMGMRPAVVALIIAPVLTMSKGMRPALYAVVVLTAVVIWGLALSPVYTLLAGALGGILWSVWVVKLRRR